MKNGGYLGFKHRKHGFNQGITVDMGCGWKRGLAPNFSVTILKGTILFETIRYFQTHPDSSRWSFVFFFFFLLLLLLPLLLLTSSSSSSSSSSSCNVVNRHYKPSPTGTNGLPMVAHGCLNCWPLQTLWSISKKMAGSILNLEFLPRLGYKIIGLSQNYPQPHVS